MIRSNSKLLLAFLLLGVTVLLMGKTTLVHGQEAATAESSASATDDAAAADVADATTAEEIPEPVAEEVVVDLDEETATADATEEEQATQTTETTAEAETETTQQSQETASAAAEPVKQSGPFIDLFGGSLLSLEMIDESTAQFKEHLTNDALAGKKVVGVYFSADWCGPCRQFTPELVSFYNKMNSRRGKKDQFEIIWVSRCRDVNSYSQYFTHMNWLALPPDEAMGARGQMLSEKYKVKGIPSLVLLDDLGNVITTDARYE